ncbi:uncharacterized protein LOC143914694 [Arctopsyche grandis]|uniref:uncharacterized protein LOC143914694 n=1 Tax=Arctopsyche grandis TaxID=121162 RepID=UPI00406D9CDE
MMAAMVNRSLFILIFVSCAMYIQCYNVTDLGNFQVKEFINPVKSCKQITKSDEALKHCIILKQALSNVENAVEKDFDDDPEFLNTSINRDKNLATYINDVFLAKLYRLRDFLNSNNFNLGYPGLMDNFRIFGIPLSKIWSLIILLDLLEM